MRETAVPAAVEARRALPVWLWLVLFAVAFGALALPYALRHAPLKHPGFHKPVAMPRKVVPQTVVPTVEPAEFQQVSPEDARAFNAAVPFSTAPNPAARPFGLSGSDESRARAVDCLAAAVLYEAGDDARGERAVAQVVLNRVRHPAFPKTVCGVVFQGSERSTGCQFTFTCDGALARQVSPAAWGRAQSVARAALNGLVDKVVGHATHYHTDWVVPYWSSSLDKIVAVETHLFYRWSGWWGTPPAFRGAYGGEEPIIPALAALSPAHGLPIPEGAELLPGQAAPGLDPAVVNFAAVPDIAARDANTLLSTLPGGARADDFPAIAQRACGDRPYCKFLAWTPMGGAPAGLPITPSQQKRMAFSYLRDRSLGFEKALWNCGAFNRDQPGECMKVEAPRPAADVAGPQRPRLAADEAPSPFARPAPATAPAAEATGTPPPAAAPPRQP